MTADVSEFKAVFPFDTPLRLKFDAEGLIPVVAQDAVTKEVLLLAYMNAEALDATLATGMLTLWSRSRGVLWRKGETSGQTLRVSELRVNCEANTLLAMVVLEGVAVCHEGYRSCFYRTFMGDSSQSLTTCVVETRIFDPATVYSGRREVADAMERDARTLYVNYERLRDAPPIPGSKTSLLLHSSDAPMASRMALARVEEELEELRGVLAGTHQHFGDERDVTLEASQVGYWVMVAAVALGLPYDAWQPHRAWLAGWDGARMEAVDSLPQERRMMVATLWVAGGLCRVAGVHPAQVVAADLREMRAKHGDADE